MQESIGSSDNLINHYNEISKQCRDDNYMKSRIELFEMLMEAEEDAAKGRVSSIDNVKIKFTKMDRLFFTNLDRII